MVASTVTEKTALDYLTALYGRCDDGDIVLTQGPHKVSAVFKTSQLQEAAAHIEKSQADLFIKVNPMDHSKTLARNSEGVGGNKEVTLIVSLHLDVDANKSDKYLTREGMLATLDDMPHPPSMVVQTNGDVGGFHAYWTFEEPYRIVDDADRERVSKIAKNWLAELQERAAKRLVDRTDGDSKKVVVDHTADISRLLRPVGSKRTSGNRVQAYRWDVHKRYQLSDFELPNRVVAPKQEYKPTEGDSVIGEYLNASGQSVETILERQGYKRFDERGKWIRPESSSGQYTGEIWIANGVRGFTCKSGGAAPLEPGWYSPENLFVTFEHGGQWTKAAAFCHEQIEAQKPKVDTSSLVSDTRPKADKAEQPPTPITTPAVKLLDGYFQQLASGKHDQLIALSSVLSGIEIGPSLLTVLGAGPGAGKTTLAMQVCFEAVERDPNLKIVIANAETAFEGLLRRELTSMTGIKSHKLRFGPLNESEQQTISKAVDEIRPRLSRMEILKECSHAGLQALRSEPPGGLVVDYLQKFSPPGDPRQGTNQVMATLRDLAKLGWWVLCLSATARTNGKGGSGHDSKQLTQASYRESGDIEFNADSCYLLIDNGAVDGEEFKRRVTLSHVKNRHGAKRDQDLIFNMPQQRFEDAFDFSELTTWSGQNPFGGVDDES